MVVPDGDDSFAPAMQTDDMDSIGAQATLEQVMAERSTNAGERAAAKQAIESQYQFYYQCPACLRAAIYFTEDPQNLPLIEDHHWRAIYHDPSDRYESTYVWCQQCYMDGWIEEEQESHNLVQLPWARKRIHGKRGFKIGFQGADWIRATRKETPAAAPTGDTKDF